MRCESVNEAGRRKTILRIVRASLLSSAAVLNLAGCSESRPTPPPPQITIAFAYPVQPQSALARIAVHEGYFSEEGLRVVPQSYSYGKEALDAALAGRADFANVAETPIMFSIMKGKKFFVLATATTSTKNNAVVARRDAGIARARDLKGKRIGFVPETTNDFFLHSFLTANGIPWSGIRPVPMKPEEMPAAIAQGRVDAVCIWNYILPQIEAQLGTNGISFYDNELYTETFNIVAREDFVAAHPDAARRFMHALVRAEEFAASHPDKAQSIVAADLHIEPGLVRRVWETFTYHVELTPMLLVTLDDETRWAMKNGLVRKTDMPDYQKYLYGDALAAVNPQAVLINR